MILFFSTTREFFKKLYFFPRLMPQFCKGSKFKLVISLFVKEKVDVLKIVLNRNLFLISVWKDIKFVSLSLSSFLRMCSETE